MLLLQVLTIIMGVMIAGTRLVCLASPCASRKMMQGMVNRKIYILVMALVIAILGSLLLWSARRAVWVVQEVELSRAIWAFILGGWASLAGLGVLLFPQVFVRMLNYMQGRSDNVIRLVMLLGLLVGLAILYLGIWVYG